MRGNTMDSETVCAVRSCKHPRRSHTTWGECTEKRGYYNEHLYGFDQPGIYKLCGCKWSEPVEHATRAIRDDPQA